MSDLPRCRPQPRPTFAAPFAIQHVANALEQIRVGLATKIEKPSRQQRTYTSRTRIVATQPWASNLRDASEGGRFQWTNAVIYHRKTTKEPSKDSPGYREGQGRQGQEGEINAFTWTVKLGAPKSPGETECFGLYRCFLAFGGPRDASGSWNTRSWRRKGRIIDEIHTLCTLPYRRSPSRAGGM